MQTLPGARGICWLDIEVMRDDEGAPSLQLHGLAAKVAGHAPGLTIHLSLTHSDTTAMAFAVAEQRSSNS
jgi:phosphopantetheinyl transferase (holo-ACP synthase)